MENNLSIQYQRMSFQDTNVLVSDRRFNTSMKQSDPHKDYVLDVLPYYNIYLL